MDQHHHHNSSSSYDEPQHPSSSASSSGANASNASDAGFFERERNRLIQDISKGVESILGNANAVNRKVEESISVGKEFHPISELWSKFERIMQASGISNLHPQPATSSANSNTNTATSAGGNGNGASGGEDKENAVVGGMGGVATPKRKPSGEEGAEDGVGLKFELTTSTAGLPPGVAPGGGRIYAA